MRRILFRALSIDGCFVTGDIIQRHEQLLILSHDNRIFHCIPNTQNQFTGFFDRMNQPLFEHDMLINYQDDQLCAFIVFDQELGAWTLIDDLRNFIDFLDRDQALLWTAVVDFNFCRRWTS